jgi:hypothetical protein
MADQLGRPVGLVAILAAETSQSTVPHDVERVAPGVDDVALFLSIGRQAGGDVHARGFGEPEQLSDEVFL